ncbi:MAG: D-amino-acid transaminase, partial [Rhodospirillales bacterium]|nr:D-amino-acid transaminase [Rhodospirillales bacterium]
AAIHIEDRGYQFADGVYEVVGVNNGVLIDEAPHFDRLERSLKELRIEPPTTRRVLSHLFREMLRRNRITNGMIYLQITRGIAPRAHAFPDPPVQASLVLTARSIPAFDLARHARAVSVITIPDTRWKRCDIKSVSLLPNILGKQAATEAGAYEAWMVDGEGFVTEGTSSNAWIVNDRKELITRNLSNAILPGITRQAVSEIARREGVVMVERPFTVKEAQEAVEAFLTSTTSFVRPVSDIDGVKIGTGQTGPLSHNLLVWYADRMNRQAVDEL